MCTYRPSLSLIKDEISRNKVGVLESVPRNEIELDISSSFTPKRYLSSSDYFKIVFYFGVVVFKNV